MGLKHGNQEIDKYGVIIDIAKQVSKEVDGEKGLSIPVTSNTNVRPSLIPWDAVSRDKIPAFTIECRGVSGWPRLDATASDPTTVRISHTVPRSDDPRMSRSEVVWSATSPFDEIDVRSVVDQFSGLIRNALSHGCEINVAPIDPPRPIIKNR